MHRVAWPENTVQRKFPPPPPLARDRYFLGFDAKQAFRVAIPLLEKLASVAKPGVADAASMRELASAWNSMAKMHDIHSMHEESVIFPILEGFFPGHVRFMFLLVQSVTLHLF